MNARRLYSAVLAVAALAACADNSLVPTEARQPLAQASPELISEGEGIFQRYVAIGTSISMGVQSDGVYAATQQTSWPAQLARLAHRELSLPLIQAPGCAAPFAAPLASGVRTSGEGAGLAFSLRQCMPNESGVVLPTGNVAIDGARTGHALTATPENPDPGHASQYPRVLAPGQSQVTAMEAQNPKVVSVELGGNDILGASHGFYLPGINVVPVSAWEPQYRQVVARVDAAAKHAVLVGLLNDVRSFPAFRTGAEFWGALRYADVLEQADVVTSDGMPLVWMLRGLGLPDASRVYGPDLTPEILAAAERDGIPVGFYGGTEHVLTRLLSKVQQQYPNLRIQFSEAPPFRAPTPEEERRTVHTILRSDIRILFVGLGSTKQDQWMHAHRGKIDCVMLGIGAAFDFLAGAKPQAPRWMQRSGLEWLFRLVTEPRRLGRRYLKHNPRFAMLALAQLIGNRWGKTNR